jgi:hypothetical protein
MMIAITVKNIVMALEAPKPSRPRLNANAYMNVAGKSEA